MANYKNKLPQEGTNFPEVRESLTESLNDPVSINDSVCPSYSGGGNNRQESLGSPIIDRKKDRVKRGKGRDIEEERLASDSDASVHTMASTHSIESGSRLWRQKKKRPREDALESSSEDGAPSAFKTPASVSVLNAADFKWRKDVLAQERLKARSDLEKELEERSLNDREGRAALGLQMADMGDDRTVDTLGRRVAEDIDVILKVALKSGNLKGTFQRALKDSAASIRAIVEVLQKRTFTEENAKLQTANARLQGEMAELRKEMADLRREVAQAKAVPASLPTQRPSPERTWPKLASIERRATEEELTRSIMMQVGGMMNARLEALEERLLPEKRVRPALAADRPKATTAPKSAVSKQAIERPERVNLLEAAPNSSNEGWTSVVSRKKRRKRKKAAVPLGTKAVLEQSAGPSRRKAQPAAAKLRSPRSTAVVITLQPGAEERGITYAKVLAEARAKVDLSSCGIVGLRYRQAVSGACMLEVPGATSADKADSLAQKLRQTLSAEFVKISRPTKCAEMRVSGLDDSIAAHELAEAIAACGGCSSELVKVGEIRRDGKGVGTAWVRCPVAAAKKLGEGRRLLVGWVSAQVRLLQPRAMCCFRCLQKGHVRAQCTAEIDRSDECYRCGQPGHKAANCCAKPRCSLCSTPNKPAEHRMGSKACAPPKVKKGPSTVTCTRPTSVPATTSGSPTATGEREAMITN